MRKVAGMAEVIDSIRHGEWELGYGDGSRGDGRYWIQRGGLGRGGESRTVSITTIKALEKRHLIKLKQREPKQPFWLRKYQYIGSGED